MKCICMKCINVQCQVVESPISKKTDYRRLAHRIISKLDIIFFFQMCFKHVLVLTNQFNGCKHLHYHNTEDPIFQNKYFVYKCGRIYTQYNIILLFQLIKEHQCGKMSSVFFFFKFSHR
jgi:hypothetical protein